MLNEKFNSLICEKEQNIRRGILEKIAHLYPFSGLYAAGSICQNFIEPLRLGYKQSEQYRKFYERSEWWDREEISRYQNSQLSKLMQHVYDNVPYYRSLFKKLSLSPEDFKSTDDLRKLPILSRKDVKQNYDKLLACNIDKKQALKRLQRFNTSGSTGTPMSVYRDGSLEFRDRTAMSWAFGLAGVKPSQRHICLRQKPFIYNKRLGRKFYEPYWMRLTLSTKECEDSTFDEYLALMKSFSAGYCIGSPAMMYLLALQAKRGKSHPIRFKAFISKYENIYEFQAEVIRRQFHCQVFRYYSSEEFLLMAADCPDRSMHVDIRKGFLEVVKDSLDSAQKTFSGRIIYTGFNNYIMPLIRYDTGDTGRLDHQDCKCARRFPVLAELNGKGAEVMFYSGKYITPITVSTILEDQAVNIAVKECQFIQTSADKLLVNVVPEEWNGIIHKKQLRQLIINLVGQQIDLQFNYLSVIPRTEMGKFQLIKNKCKENQK